jgi:BlaI family transcriptional regulator, penicillinase repressor
VSDVPTPTPRELEILKVLWHQGPCSVRTVLQQLQGLEPGLAFNTIQTMLRIMEKKGLVDHAMEGRTFIYTATFTRDESTGRFLDGVFDGAVSELVQSLFRTERVSAAELRQLQAMIDAAKKKGDR